VDEVHAALAQLVEQLICNQQVVGSTPARGSNPDLAFHAVYLGKRSSSGFLDVSREFSSIRAIGPCFPSWCGPNVAQGCFFFAGCLGVSMLA
jgi:hypothetical protein